DPEPPSHCFTGPPPTQCYALSLHDALPICRALRRQSYDLIEEGPDEGLFRVEYADIFGIPFDFTAKPVIAPPQPPRETVQVKAVDRKSTRLNSSHVKISYAVFCLKKKKHN